MLYDVHDERVLKEGYQVKYVLVQRQGQNMKYVPIYHSPSGADVFEDEATVKGLTIVEVTDTAPSRRKREDAIAKLISILRTKPFPNVDRSQVEHAIEVMALEDDLKLQAGQQVAESLPPENPASAPFAVKLLEASNLKDAIGPLTRLLEYEASWDHHSCCEDEVHDIALAALRRFIADNFAFRHEAALAALELLDRQGSGYEGFYRTWSIEVLIGLV